MMTMGRLLIAIAAVTAANPPLALGQDTLPPIEQGVRIGITYTPGLRPGMLVLGGSRTAALDSARAIVWRDLDFSDRFELITLPGGDSLALGITTEATEAPRGPNASGGLYVNYSLYAALGADYAAAVLPGRDSAEWQVLVFDVRGEAVRERFRVPVLALDDPGFRMAVHRASDAVVQAATGEIGAAATRLLFLRRGTVYRVDADGEDLQPVSGRGTTAFSPAWAPDGRAVAYSNLVEGWAAIHVHDLETGARRTVRPTSDLLNIAAAFSPDGAALAFTRIGPEGSEIYRYNLARDCCLERLTVDRFSDNLSPTFSPDGRQIAFVSDRAGLPQIYVMAADGTGQELFAPFDYGVTGSSNAPEWSPDGTRLAFHRVVAGSPQVFIMDVRSRVVRQLTSAGRNEDPTWAPDGRHLAFISNRTGRRQVWIIDIETGRVRQLTAIGDARLPAWSRRLAEPNN